MNKSSTENANVIVPNVIAPPANAIQNVYKSWIIFMDYVKVINEYTHNYESSAKYKKKDKDNAYLMLNGYNALTHVFKMGISYTRNPYFALKNMHRSIYYYTQFIDQMDENIMFDLNLSSNSASLFLYKKMVEEIEQYTGNNEHGTEQIEPIEPAEPIEPIEPVLKYDFCKNIETLINIYKLLFESMVLEYSPINIAACLNEIMVELCNGANASANASAAASNASAAANASAASNASAAEPFFQQVLENVKIFINHFSAINNTTHAYIKTYIQKYSQQPLTIIDLYKKKTERDYEMILNEGNANKYIKWLIK